MFFGALRANTISTAMLSCWKPKNDSVAQGQTANQEQSGLGLQCLQIHVCSSAAGQSLKGKIKRSNKYAINKNAPASLS